MSKNKLPLQVAVVGCGLISQWHHIPILMKMRDVKLASICDENEDLVKGTARRFGVDKYYTDYSEMLSIGEVNMVNICTPPQTHLKLSMQAIEAGCHVLVEKPMALDLSFLLIFQLIHLHSVMTGQLISLRPGGRLVHRVIPSSEMYIYWY